MLSLIGYLIKQIIFFKVSEISKGKIKMIEKVTFCVRLKNKRVHVGEKTLPSICMRQIMSMLPASTVKSTVPVGNSYRYR